MSRLDLIWRTRIISKMCNLSGIVWEFEDCVLSVLANGEIEYFMEKK